MKLYAAIAALCLSASAMAQVQLGKNVQIGGSGTSSGFITSLTTTGTSGAATVTSGVLNIPQYTFNFTLGATPITNGSTITAVTGLSVNGVSLNAAGSTTLFLNQAGGYTTPTGSGGISALTGDGAATGPGSAAFTLATVNGAPGACGDATHVCQITTNGKGLTTGQTAVAITATGAVASVTNSDGTLTITPTTGAVIGSLNLAHANTWTAPISVAVAGGQGGTFDATEGTAATATAGHDVLYGDSVSHCLKYSANGGSFACIGTGTGGITALTGDVTASGTGSVAATLATVNSSPGACGDATHVCQVTTNGKGLTTAQTAVAITGGSSSNSAQTMILPNDSTGTTSGLMSQWHDTSRITYTIITTPLGATSAGTNGNPPLVGVCVSNCGTTGFGTFQYAGNVSWVCDGQTKVGDWVSLASSATFGSAGECTDPYGTSSVGTTAYINENPEINSIVGVVTTANTGAHTASIINLIPFYGFGQSFSGLPQHGQGFMTSNYGSPFPTTTYWGQNLTTASGGSGSSRALSGGAPIDLWNSTGFFEINPGISGLGVSGRDIVFDNLSHGFGIPPTGSLRFNASTYNVPTVATVTGTTALAVTQTTGVYQWTLSGNTTLSAPSVDNAGHIITFDIIQAATGGPFTFTWNAVFKNPPTVSTVASSHTVSSFYYDGTFYDCLSGCPGSGAVTAVTATSPIVSSGGLTPVISCPTCGTSTASSITVNGGSSLGTANLNGTTPSAPINTNVTFQVSGSNVSAYVPLASLWTAGSYLATGGGTPWASTSFAGAMDTNNGTSDGGPWRGYYAANKNIAFNVSSNGVPASCTTAEIMRYVIDDGESGGAVIGGIDRAGNICGWQAFRMSSSGTINWNGDTNLSRTAAGGVSVDTSTAGNGLGTIRAAAYVSTGTKFTTSGCSVSSTTGGASAGVFTLGANSCTVVITMNGATGITAPNGWTCQAHDRTAPTILIGGESPSTTTTASITIPAGAGATDVISFSCTAY